MTSAPTSFTSLALIAVAAGCASPRPAPIAPVVAGTHEAEAELARGCYDCVIAARDAYTRAKHVKGEFEANVILAIRAKELGLRGSRAIYDARVRDREVPDARRILSLVDAIPDESVSPRARRLYRDDDGNMAKDIEADRRWLYTSSFDPNVRGYLALALDCAFEPLPGVPAIRTTVPLLAYRKEICGLGRISALAELRKQEPRFVETSYAMAMTELAMMSVAGPQHAQEHLDEVRAKFPTSTQAWLALGTYLRAVMNHRDALAVYDHLLRDEPDLVDAKLGRVYCLGALGKPQDAVELASQLIDDGDYVDQMLPERAAQYRALGRLDLARHSIDTAKDLSPQPRTLQLAGIIEYEQGDLATAKLDLALVVDADDDDCTSRWYLGLVAAKQGDAMRTEDAFVGAVACYRHRAAESITKSLALRERGDVDPAYLASQLAALDASSDADLKQSDAGMQILDRLRKSQASGSKRRDK